MPDVYFCTDCGREHHTLPRWAFIRRARFWWAQLKRDFAEL